MAALRAEGEEVKDDDPFFSANLQQLQAYPSLIYLIYLKLYIYVFLLYCATIHKLYL